MPSAADDLANDLADDLADDFAESGGEDGHQGDVDMDEDENGVSKEQNGDADEDMQNANGEADEEKEFRLQHQKVGQGLENAMRFMELIKPLVGKIEEFRSRPKDAQVRPAEGQVEDNPEYEVLTKSNERTTEIDDHKIELHKFIRDHYSVRFPELETLLGDPIEYTKAVAVIGNGPMDQMRDITASSDNILGQPLNMVLSRPKLMTITVEATTSKGQPLAAHQLERIRTGCKLMLELEAAKQTLTSYVQSRMNIFAPNLTTLVGSRVAAQLLAARGGLRGLAETRSANLPSLGVSRSGYTSGLATNVGVRNQGFVYSCDIVQRFRAEHRTQAMRVVSGKVVLAARIDLARQTPDGTLGESLRDECEKKLEKQLIAPSNKGPRALPAPDDKPAKKRGGRRARLAKEQNGMTDLRKAQNRMQFGKEEAEAGYGTGDSTVGMGMIGQSNDGRIRGMQVDSRTRARLSKKNQGFAANASSDAGGTVTSLDRLGGDGDDPGTATGLRSSGLRSAGVATQMGAGTASSLAFGSRQGLELVDPRARAEAERKQQAERDKYFQGGTFTMAGGTGTATGLRTQGGFKIPALPVKRKATEQPSGEGHTKK